MSFEPLHARLRAHAAARPTAPALRFGAAAFDFAALAGRIDGMTAALAGAGVRRGDRVLLMTDDPAAFAIGYFAVHAAGAVACPLAPDLPAERVAEIVERLGPRAAVGDAAIAGLRTLPAAAAYEASGNGAAAPLSPDDPADILFTSGTTGRPKAVCLSHGNIAAAAEAIADFMGNGADDREALPLPLSHSFGLGRLRSMAHVGNSLLLEKGLSRPAQLFRSMLTQGATGLALVPAGLEILRRSLGDHLATLAPTLRYLEIGSAPMRPELRDWLLAALPDTRICHHYGLTEASRAVFLDLRDREAQGSVGRPSLGVGVDVVGADGAPLPRGQIGELVVRGAVVSTGYLDDPELTRRRMTPGGFRTGDVGYVDERGYVFLEGRLDEMINVGGKKVGPAEVEAALLTHPAVADAACAGRPDEVLGEAVAAFVVAGPGFVAEDVRRHVAERLEPHKRPVEITSVRALPRTASGKLQRFRLHEAAWIDANRDAQLLDSNR
jgi:long-chain acyl-CoA synthetase